MDLFTLYSISVPYMAHTKHFRDTQCCYQYIYIFSTNQNFRQTPIATVQTPGSSPGYFNVQNPLINNNDNTWREQFLVPLYKP